MVTLNVGVLQGQLHRIIWGVEAPPFVGAPSCTAWARIGELAGGRDLWWDLDDVRSPAQLANLVAVTALPFFERMHLPDGIETFLESSGGSA